MEEEEDDHDHDEQGLGEGLQHLVDGVLDVEGRVVGDAGLHPGRQLGLDLRHERPHLGDHVEGVGGGEHPHAHEGRGLAVEADVLVVVLRPQHDVGHLAQADHDALVLLDHELAELFGRPEVGVRDQVDGDHRALRLAQGRQVVVPGQGPPKLGGRDPEGRHLVRLEPDAHGEGAVAEDVGALHAADGGELRLDHAGQVVGDLVLVQLVGGEAEVHRGELVVRGLELDDRRLGLRGQVVADLRHLRLKLGEGGARVVVELQVHGDGAQGLGARGLHVVDAVGAGDDALEGGRDEAPHEVGAGANVSRGDTNDRDVAPGVLPHRQGADRLQAGDQDDQVDDDGQDRPLDEQVCEAHQLSSGFGAGSLPGWISL